MPNWVKNDGCGGVECYSKESGHCNARDEVFYPAFKADEIIYELKRRIEDIQASNYAVCTDLGMDCRRYLRELWRSRARNAHTQVRFWTVRNACAFTSANIEGRIPGILKDVPEVKGILRTQGEWIRIWEKVEKLCSAYALNYTNTLR